MSQKIKVTKAEHKPVGNKGGSLHAFWDEKNTRFSGFLSELSDVQVGDTIDVEIQADGKYLNITALKGVEHGGAAAPAPGVAPATPVYPARLTISHKDESPEVRASIEAQVAVKAVTELLSNNYPVPDDTKDGFFHTLNHWMNVTVRPVVKAAADPNDPHGIFKERPTGEKTPTLADNMKRAKWSDSTALEYLKNVIKAPIQAGDNFITAFGRLTAQQASDFEKLMATKASQVKG
jgi:hypothetical protein